jgi:aminopeptidase YwaD
VSETHLVDQAERYLNQLCLEIPTRRVGSAGNRAATDFFAQRVAALGFETETPTFACIDWVEEGADLRVGDAAFAVSPSPYSLGCRVEAPLVSAATEEALEALDPRGKVLLLHGEVAREQLMPKNFPFYNPERHQRIVRMLEEKAPAAIVAATSRDPALAGGIYPFPLIEDGDFDVPSVHMTAEEGARLLPHVGQTVTLVSEARRIPATGCNVVARKGGDPNRRVVLFAHIDAKRGSPGAIDNGTGVVILLLLAELLADYAGELGVEIVALNGEDYYAASGEIQFVERNAGRFEEIVLGVNLDAPGYREGHTAYSLYDCPEGIAAAIHRAFSPYDELVEGERWYQSDHGLFIQHQRPALAITSEQFVMLSTEITHTPKDHPRVVDTAKLVPVARGLRDLLLALNRRPA